MTTKSKNAPSFTKDYDRFILDGSNRQLVRNRDLEESMVNHGFFPFRPICVVPVGSRLRVIDGHHRLAAAMKLGIGVWYIVIPEDVSVLELERSVRVHKPLDYAQVYIGEGHPEYLRLAEYATENGITVMYAHTLALGTVNNSSNVYANDFIRGNFKWNDSPEAEKYRATWAAIVSAAEAGGCDFARQRGFVSAAMALAKMVDAKKLDRSRLIDRLRKRAGTIGRYGHRNDLLSEVEDVYNWNTRDKIALKHETLKHLMESRSAAMKAHSDGLKKKVSA